MLIEIEAWNIKTEGTQEIHATKNFWNIKMGKKSIWCNIHCLPSPEVLHNCPLKYDVKYDCSVSILYSECIALTFMRISVLFIFLIIKSKAFRLKEKN